MMDGYGLNLFGLGFGGITMLLFWGLLIGMVVLAFWSLSRGNRTHSGDSGRSTSDRSMEILRERYARGEISKDEYDRMRHDLSQ